jgi:hypothetical protein
MPILASRLCNETPVATLPALPLCADSGSGHGSVCHEFATLRRCKPNRQKADAQIDFAPSQFVTISPNFGRALDSNQYFFCSMKRSKKWEDKNDW